MHNALLKFIQLFLLFNKNCYETLNKIELQVTSMLVYVYLVKTSLRKAVVLVTPGAVGGWLSCFVSLVNLLFKRFIARRRSSQLFAYGLTLRFFNELDTSEAI